MTKYYPDLIAARGFMSFFYQIRKLISALIISGIVFLVISCEEDPSKIGTGILPGRDFVSIISTDTISVNSFTQYEAASRSENQPYGLLGSVYNPYFGITTAEFVSQVRLGSRWYAEAFTVDSVKLRLRFEDVQGDAASIQQLAISEISEELFTDSPYYSNTPVQLTGYDVATVEIPVLKADTINSVNFDLPVAFGEYLLRDTTKLFHSNSRADFRSFFKGLYFRITSSTSHRMLTINLRRSATSSNDFYNYFIIYYHNASGDRKAYYLILDAKNPNARFNRFAHDFEASDPERKIGHLNDGFKDTLSYVQSLNGAFTKIVLPGLETIKNDPALSNIAINKARLTVPVFKDSQYLTNTTIAKQIYLTYKLRDTSYYVPDYNISSSFFDGKLDTVKNVYNFNIVTFVQRYLEDSANELKPELEMIVSEGPDKNVVLKANDSSTPAKFIITYTKF